jgi:hypothetical protein
MPTNKWREVEIPELKSKGAESRESREMVAALMHGSWVVTPDAGFIPAVYTSCSV